MSLIARPRLVLLISAMGLISAILAAQTQDSCPTTQAGLARTGEATQATEAAGRLSPQVQTINERLVVTTSAGTNNVLDAMNTNATANGNQGIAGRANGPRDATGVFGGVGVGAGTTAATGNAGVRGLSVSAGPNYGVEGFLRFNTSHDSAGVHGVDGSDLTCSVNSYLPAGVRGDSKNYRGVLGVSQGQGVSGKYINNQGLDVNEGVLGTEEFGVFSSGDIGAIGRKLFLEPHPTDATKVIRFVALEGPEAGTYFRGTARTERGIATIEVPEAFAIVSDPDGLTVQLTAIGSPASIYVASQDLNRIVVRTSRDVTFHYLVQGVRRAYKGEQPIVESRAFVPESAKARIPLSLPEEVKRRLIANGTYNPDGTVNLEMARALGWTTRWAEQSGDR